MPLQKTPQIRRLLSRSASNPQLPPSLIDHSPSPSLEVEDLIPEKESEKRRKSEVSEEFKMLQKIDRPKITMISCGYNHCLAITEVQQLYSWGKVLLEIGWSFCAKKKDRWAILPICYIIGLIFILKTHAHILEDPSISAEEEAPIGMQWSKTTCVIILLLSTVLVKPSLLSPLSSLLSPLESLCQICDECSLYSSHRSQYSLVAEILVETLQPTIDLVGISQTFAGLTILAIIPSVAEFENAIQFALSDSISLSLSLSVSFGFLSFEFLSWKTLQCR